MIRRVLVCLAFAAWCFLDTWVEYAEGGVAYFARHAPLQAVVKPVLLAELLITVGLFVLWGLCRRFGGLIVHFGFLAACYWPLGIALIAVPRLLQFDLATFVRHRGFWPAALACAILPLGFALLRPRQASGLVRGMLLCSWPALLLLQAQAVRTTLLATSYADGTLAPPLPQQAGHARLIWVVFDEMSQSLTFDQRPAGLALPEFDRLTTETFHASAAEPPSQMTRQSMPALIVGELMLNTQAAGPTEFLVQTPTRPEWTGLRSISNVFDTARELGLNTAVAGWYHPYGRLLNHSLTRCYWTAGLLPTGVEERMYPQGLPDAIWDRVGLQLAALPLAGRLMSPLADHRREKLAQFSWLRARALELASDPTLGLVLIHLPVPHPPSISGAHGYGDSLELADRTLGELRRAMEAAGMWEASAVLVSSDHSWRPWLWRGDDEWTAADETAAQRNTSSVPFLLKLPGGNNANTAYGKAFNTVVTRRIITGVLAGEIKDPRDVAAAIEGSPKSGHPEVHNR